MANLRDIINAATPGPWRSESGVVRVGVGGLNAIAYTDTVGLFGKDAGSNARHIAAYSPDHALLIEAVIPAGPYTKQGECFYCFADQSEAHHADCPFDKLRDYRKANGYE